MLFFGLFLPFSQEKKVRLRPNLWLMAPHPMAPPWMAPPWGLWLPESTLWWPLMDQELEARLFSSWLIPHLLRNQSRSPSPGQWRRSPPPQCRQTCPCMYLPAAVSWPEAFAISLSELWSWEPFPSWSWASLSPMKQNRIKYDLITYIQILSCIPSRRFFHRPWQVQPRICERDLDCRHLFLSLSPSWKHPHPTGTPRLKASERHWTRLRCQYRTSASSSNFGCFGEFRLGGQ